MLLLFLCRFELIFTPTGYKGIPSCTRRLTFRVGKRRVLSPLSSCSMLGHLLPSHRNSTPRSFFFFFFSPPRCLFQRKPLYSPPLHSSLPETRSHSTQTQPESSQSETFNSTTRHFGWLKCSNSFCRAPVRILSDNYIHFRCRIIYFQR